MKDWLSEYGELLVTLVIAAILAIGLTMLFAAALGNSDSRREARDQKITEIFMQSEGSVEYFIDRCTKETDYYFSGCADLVRGLYNEDEQ
jgi:hypothetical protein